MLALSRHSWPLLSLALLASLGALACGDDRGAESDEGVSSLGPTSTFGGDDSGDEASSDGESSTATTTLDTSGEGCVGDDECPEGQVCLSASDVCFAEGGCIIDDDCDDGQICQDGVCAIGGDCGGFEFSIEAVPPNLLILLDRSGSMESSVSNTDLNRWEVAVMAIAQVTGNFDDVIRFGLATYSACTGNGCSAGTTVVPIADMNAAAINNFLAATAGEGSSDGSGLNGDGKIKYLCDSGDPETSTGKSLNAQVGAAELQDSARTNAIMLITDGSESGDCVDNGINGPTAAANLLGQAIPVQTFAVGFGGANTSEINNIAQAGGTEVGYLAEQADQLEAAFDTIANAVATCTFELDQVPPDADEIYVFFDKDPEGVPNDASEGWTYDPDTNTVTFHGSACESIKGGTIVDIDIVYGCDQPPIG
ncbi:VWA domain-containing protein [Pseudenhygromyxa sp. WMMC2535]|uniref:vWA domain-containing protein n=1 Tax=Pseudenhygromyxa sp. WMMC2535 TaxID=2712867 RepID=UPI00155631D6|nr:vWA domain-containing protein [Pseudenhygromyxa sp. WMMC2535]NVB38251.1 VWA domain-containing protein [Pseudenhygromyxa sp. WMMC2535]